MTTLQTPLSAARLPFQLMYKVTEAWDKTKAGLSRVGMLVEKSETEPGEQHLFNSIPSARIDREVQLYLVMETIN
jgi:hypothetical protein